MAIEKKKLSVREAFKELEDDEIDSCGCGCEVPDVDEEPKLLQRRPTKTLNRAPKEEPVEESVKPEEPAKPEEPIKAEEHEDDDSQILDESIDDIYTKHYSDIDRAMFDKIIRVDPTFNENVDSLGKYGKWLITMFKKGTVREDSFTRAREVLADFHNRKRFITEPANGQDIGAYKTLDEIIAALDNIQLTQNQIAKQARKAKHFADLGDQAEFITENDEYEIWKPKTYAASCKLGSGAVWCTASTSSTHHYTQYTSNGNLYVFMPKDGNVHKKYQASVKNDGRRVDSFLDWNNSPYTGGGGRGEDASQSKDLARFLMDKNLLDAVKDSELKDIDSVVYADNITRIKNGEPYIYNGGKVDASLAKYVKKIKFSPDFTSDTIPGGAFAGCTELEKIIIPVTVTTIGSMAFKGCDKVTIYTVKHPISVWPPDRDFILSKLKYMVEKK